MRSLLVAALSLTLLPWPVLAASKTKPVSVTNFPATQNVNGSVSVSNLPAVQNVSGQVQVTNLPAVEGEVEVTNLPAVQDVNVVNGCGTNEQLLGFTEAVVPPSLGILTLAQACGEEFAGSHVCTSEEIIGAAAIPAGLSGLAWVRPVLQAHATQGGLDASGLTNNPNAFTCNGWSANDLLGLAVSGMGAFEFQPCSGALPVACCGAAQ